MSDVTEEPREPKPEDNEPTRPLPPLTTQPTPKPLPGRTDDLPDGLIAVGVIAALVLLFVVAAWGIPKASTGPVPRTGTSSPSGPPRSTSPSTATSPHTPSACR